MSVTHADAATQAAEQPRLEARFAPSSYDPDTRTVTLSWGRGVEVERYDWRTEQRYIERLEVNADAVDLARLNRGAPLLDTHSRWSLESVIGTVERAWIENGEGMAVVRFSARAEVQPILDDVRDGILRNVSVGYGVDEWKESRDAAGRLVRTAVRWTPHEISLVPVPADASAQVRAAGSAPAPLSRDNPAQEGRMAADKTDAPEAPAQTTTPAPGADEVRAAERARIASLDAPAEQARAMGMDETSLAALRATAIADGWEADQFRARLLDALAKGRAFDQRAGASLAAQPGVQPRPVQILSDEGDVLRERLAAALTVRLTGGNSYTPETREFARIGFQGVAKELLASAGVRNLHRMSEADVADMLFRTHSASDFAGVLANSTNKTVEHIYGQMPNTWSSWTREIDVNDFKTITAASVGHFPEPVEIAEGGPVTYGTIGEETETYAVRERGRLVELTRVALINDDTQAFQQVVEAAAVGAYTALRRAVFGILVANANMADGVALFAAGHSNLGTAGNLSATTFGELMQLLMQQGTVARTGMAPAAAPLPPPVSAALLVSPAEARTAYELLGNIIVPTAAGAALPTEYRSMTSVIVEPFLATGNQPYYLARTDFARAVQIAYLRGARTPRIDQAEQIARTGITFRVMFDFGCKAVTWRTIAGNLG